MWDGVRCWNETNADEASAHTFRLNPARYASFSDISKKRYQTNTEVSCNSVFSRKDA